MPGRRPTPTSKLKLSGSWRGKYDRKGEPEPEKVAPAKPEWLSEPAGRVWDQVTVILENMGVLSVADGLMLARYCELWCDWRESNDWIRKNGTTYPLRNKDNSVKCFMQFPQVGVRNNVGRELRHIECEFGLSPSARTRINIDLAGGSKAKARNGKSRFFSAG